MPAMSVQSWVAPSILPMAQCSLRVEAPLCTLTRKHLVPVHVAAALPVSVAVTCADGLLGSVRDLDLLCL